jgi:hypothetical protein
LVLRRIPLSGHVCAPYFRSSRRQLAPKLHLSGDQEAQIKPILADRQQKLGALLKPTRPMRPMQKQRKLKGIYEDSDKKMKAVLNAAHLPTGRDAAAFRSSSVSGLSCGLSSPLVVWIGPAKRPARTPRSYSSGSHAKINNAQTNQRFTRKPQFRQLATLDFVPETVLLHCTVIETDPDDPA